MSRERGIKKNTKNKKYVPLADWSGPHGMPWRATVRGLRATTGWYEYLGKLKFSAMNLEFNRLLKNVSQYGQSFDTKVDPFWGRLC